MLIDKSAAQKLLIEEAALAAGPVNSRWEKRIREFSETCEKGSKTHVAFLATALLAKSVNPNADAFSVKARKGPGALMGSYSVRGLVEVWTENARALGVNLGVTGREPLNNQPYFGLDRLSRTVKVKRGTEPALHALCDILDEVQPLESPSEVRSILRAFIKVRREYNPAYAVVGKTGAVTATTLARIIGAFVAANGEGGKRAQAAAAGLLDVLAGDERVFTARVNDPDTGFPGDVALRASGEVDRFNCVFEIRDKSVTCSDVEHFVEKVRRRGIENACVLAVNDAQVPLSCVEAMSKANADGVFLHIIWGWDEAVRQMLFWGSRAPDEAAVDAALRIYVRAVELEVSTRGVEAWTQAIAQQRNANPSPQ